MICITLVPWKEKHSISDPAIPFQHHPVLVHGDRAKGIVIRRSLNHPLQCQVVHPRVYILMVSTIVVVSCHETHHTAVGPDDGQELVVVPGKADEACGVGVYREVTWKSRKNMSGIRCSSTGFNDLRMTLNNQPSFFPIAIYITVCRHYSVALIFHFNACTLARLSFLSLSLPAKSSALFVRIKFYKAKNTACILCVFFSPQLWFHYHNSRLCSLLNALMGCQIYLSGIDVLVLAHPSKTYVWETLMYTMLDFYWNPAAIVRGQYCFKGQQWIFQSSSAASRYQDITLPGQFFFRELVCFSLISNFRQENGRETTFWLFLSNQDLQVIKL